MPTFSIAQLNALARGKPRYLPVVMGGGVALPTEIMEGDSLLVSDYSSIVQGYPTSTSTQNFKLNGVSQGSTYTPQTGDHGKSLVVAKVTGNGSSSAELDSNTVTISAVTGFADMGLLGGNMVGLADYATAPIFRNAMMDSRGWDFQNTYNGTGLMYGGSGNAQGGILALTQVSGLSYTLSFTSFFNNPLCNNANDVGRVFTITLSGVTYTATVTAFGAKSGGTSSCTALLSAAPPVLTGITTWTVYLKLDANGWPMQTCELVVTSSPGQLPPGVYQMTVKSLNPALVITGAGLSCYNAAHPTPTGTMNFAGVLNATTGITTYNFYVTLASGSPLILEFSDGITFADLPRDGSATSYDSNSPFNPQALACYSQFASLRFMDFFATNGKTETTWATRTPYTSAYGQFQAKPLSWEVGVDFANALYAYPGSRLKQVWFNIGGLCTVAPGNAHNGTSYVENLPLLINTWNSGLNGYAGLNPNLKVKWEYGNEPWNFAFNLWGQYITYATQELQMLSTSSYGGYYPVVSSITVSAGVATVNCTGAAPSFVVNGASMLACDGNGQYWQGTQGSSTGGSLANLTTPCIISNVTTGTDINGNPIFNFTYPVSNTNGATSLVGSATRWSCVFNLSSTLALDQLAQPVANQQSGVNAFFNTTIKWMVRQVWRLKQILKYGGVGGATRPNDQVILNLQQYGSTGPGGNAYSPPHYDYGKWLDSNTNPENTAGNATPLLGNWLYGTAIAPYVTANANATWTGGSNHITNAVIFAAVAINDTVALPSGNTNSVVQAGSTVISAYLNATVTNISGNAVTLSAHAAASTATAPGSNVMVLAKSGGSTATLGAIGVGVMLQGSNVVNFTTPIPGLAVGDTLGVHNAGQYPLNTTVVGVKAINTSSINASGTGYTAGTYTNVAMVGGTGTGAIATITVVGTTVSSVGFTNRGSGYSANDILTFAAANAGGTGSGASVKVLTLTTVIQDFGYNTFGAGGIVANGLNTINAPGTGYTNGTYNSVSLTNVSSSGSGAQANITVAGGVVTSVTIASAGSGYVVGDVLTAAAASIGGTGSGFQVTVTAADNTYAVAASGAATGLSSLANVSMNNVLVSGLTGLTGLANGDALTFIGAGNPSLYTKIIGIDNVNSILTCDKTVASQQTFSSGVFTPSTTTTTLIMTGVNPASVVKAMLINMKFSDDWIRAHVTQCKLYGVHPLSYEMGPDTQCITLWAKEVHTYSDINYGIDAMARSLLDMWFQNGGEDCHWFSVGPSAYTDGSLVPDVNGNVSPGSLGAVFTGGYLSQTAWSALQTYTDVTAPKYVAVTTYNTPKWYQNVMSYPTTYTNAITAVPFGRNNRYNVDSLGCNSYQRIDSNINAYNIALTQSGYVGTYILYFSANTSARMVTYALPVPRGGRYIPVVYGTDSVAGVQVQVLVDLVLQSAQQTIAQNGAGNVATAKPIAATGGAPIALTSGIHLVQVNLPAGVGNSTTGIWGVKLVLVQ